MQIIDIHAAWVDFKKGQPLNQSLRFGQYLYNNFNLKVTLDTWESYYEEDDSVCYSNILKVIQKIKEIKNDY